MTYNVFGHGGTLNLTPLNSTVSKVWFWHDLVRNAVCPPHSWTIFTFLYHKVAKWGCWRRDAAQYLCSWRLLGCWALHSAVHFQWSVVHTDIRNVCEHVILQKYKPLVWEFHQIYNLDAVWTKMDFKRSEVKVTTRTVMIENHQFKKCTYSMKAGDDSLSETI